jgi:hypothetical protein
MPDSDEIPEITSTDLLKQAMKQMEKAAEDDNTLEQTIYYCSNANLLALVGVMTELMKIRSGLRELAKDYYTNPARPPDDIPTE